MSEELPKQYQTTIWSAQVLAGIAMPLTLVTFGLLVFNMSAEQIFVAANAGLALAVVGVFLSFRSAMRKAQEYAAAVYLGDIDRAAEYFEAQCEKRWHLQHAFFVFQRGVCYLYSGDHAMADAIFTHLESSRAFNALLKQVRPMLLMYQSTALAMEGKLDKAEETFKGFDPDDYIASFLARAVILVRRGTPSEALEFLDARWPEDGFKLGACANAGLDAVRAFAAGESAPEDVTHVEWMATEWPEFQTWLRA